MNLKDRLLVRPIKPSIDERGFFEVIVDGEVVDQDYFGSLIVATINPGYIRGNHYHKENEDWAAVVRGRALIVAEDIDSGERCEFEVTGDDPVSFYIPTNVSHAVKNVGDEEVFLIEYSSLKFADKIKDLHTHKVVE